MERKELLLADKFLNMIDEAKLSSTQIQIINRIIDAKEWEARRLEENPMYGKCIIPKGSEIINV